MLREAHAAGQALRVMRKPAIVIDWNGTDLPRELAVLPPGRYRLDRIEGPADEPDDDPAPERLSEPSGPGDEPA